MSARGVHYTFLRSPPQQAPPSLRLYQGSWSHARALLSCAWSDDAAVIRDYLSLCRERAGEFSAHLEESLDLDSAFGAEDPCVPLASPNLGGPPGKRSVRSVDRSPPGAQEDGSKGRSLHRVKRGFIVPGTLWCGTGNKAPSSGDLGRFLPGQKCFREQTRVHSGVSNPRVLQAFLQKQTAAAASTTSARTPFCPFTPSLASSTATSSPCLTATATESRRPPPPAGLGPANSNAVLDCEQVPPLPVGGRGQHRRRGGLHLLQPAEDALL